MVWYQVESFPDFIKMYGRIHGTLHAGHEYEINLLDNYKGPTIGTNKYIHLSEVNFFGGRNFVLPWIFFGTALIILIILVMFFVCYFRKIHKKDRNTEEFINGLTY